jgi:RNA polymerase sigma factor (sigma-70 family)
LSPFPSAIRGTDSVRRFVPLREQPDERLVALARGGSDEAFSEIVRRYERPLRGYCSRIVDPVRAEDAVQQAFLHALRALRGPDRRELALKAWLHTIARNCAIDLHTGRTTHTFEELDGGALDASPSPPRLAEQREELSQLMTGLRRLPDGQRRALLLRELEGRSYEEIGAEIGRTPSGVRQTIFRARTALREAVAVFGPPVWLRTLWPFGGGASGRSLEALAAAGAAIVAIAGTAGLPASGPALDGLAGGVRPAVVAPAGVAEPSSAEPSSAPTPGGAPVAPARPPRPDAPVSRPPLPGADSPASTGPPPRPLPNPTPGKGTPDGGQTPSVPTSGGGQTPSVPGTQVVSPPPSAGQQGEGQAPPVSGSSSGSSGSGSSGPDSSGSGSSGSGSSGSGSADSSGRSGRRGHSGSGSSGSDSSGSGSDGSGSSGSDSSGSGSDGSGSSGSGSSGSGSDDDSAESER